MPQPVGEAGMGLKAGLRLRQWPGRESREQRCRWLIVLHLVVQCAYGAARSGLPADLDEGVIEALEAPVASQCGKDGLGKPVTIFPIDQPRRRSAFRFARGGSSRLWKSSH